MAPRSPLQACVAPLPSRPQPPLLLLLPLKSEPVHLAARACHHSLVLQAVQAPSCWLLPGHHRQTSAVEPLGWAAAARSPRLVAGQGPPPPLSWTRLAAAPSLLQPEVSCRLLRTAKTGTRWRTIEMAQLAKLVALLVLPACAWSLRGVCFAPHVWVPVCLHGQRALRDKLEARLPTSFTLSKHRQRTKTHRKLIAQI